MMFHSHPQFARISLHHILFSLFLHFALTPCIQGIISMLDVAVHTLKSHALPSALKANVVQLIGNSTEGMSLWATARMTP